MPDDDQRSSSGNGDASKEASSQESTPEKEELIDYWDDFLGPRPEAVRDRLVRELGLPHPGVLTLASSTGRVLVQIDPNGKVKLGPGIQPDEAAEEFWTMLALKRVGMEERLLHLGMMEALLLRVARADIAYEEASARARSDAATEEDKYRQELQQLNLESIVHQMLEFSRGLLARQAVPPDPTPPPAATH